MPAAPVPEQVTTVLGAATGRVMDDPLYKLEYLSLVSKIATELENHLGLNDRVLAEFIISLH